MGSQGSLTEIHAGDAARTGASAPGFLTGIQYLRAIAASAVVVFHAAQAAGLAFWVGEAGVDLFFLLSGFLMVVITGPDTRPGSFLRDRIRRIVPLYWIATSVVLVAALLGLFSRLELDPVHVLASYLFVPHLSPMIGKAYPLLIPGWTLNFEMFFYACFALLLGVRSRLRRVALLSAAFGCAVAAGLVFRPGSAIAATYTDPMLLEFVGGMWIGLWWTSGRTLPRYFGWPSLCVAAGLFVMVWMLNTDQLRVLLFGLPAALLLLSVLAIERRRRIAAVALPLLIGNASYSIYLWHTLAISAAALVVRFVGLPAILILPLGVAAGLAVGVLSYLWIERPLLKRLRARPRATLGQAAIAAAP